MNYPLISEYIEAIKSAEDNFEELTNLRAVLGDDGQPVMTSGNFAVVFKMEDKESGKFYALKCFTKEQEGRAEAYHQITEELKDVDSPYLISIQYLDKELFVDTKQTTETDFPVLLMDWVEGKTLDKYLRENLDDKYALDMLAYRFSQLAQWLIPQPFAHGDLKPDNILVCEDGTLVLVDYDGMYVPAMEGQNTRELGSPDFRHPLRTENDFDDRIDDFPLICMSLSLKAITINTNLLLEANNDNGLLFTTSDYLDIANSKIVKVLCNMAGDTDYYRLLGSFLICISNKSFSDISHKLFDIQEPKYYNSNYGYFTDPRDGYTYKTIKIGNQTWLAENLRYLPRIGKGYYVYDYLGNDVSEAKKTQNYKDFGVLYNMSAAQKACPVGWHIPSDVEWKELDKYLGLPDFSEEGMPLDVGFYYYRGDPGSHNIATEPCNLINITEDYGFNASLGGWRYEHGGFDRLNIATKWWSTSEQFLRDDYYYGRYYINRTMCYDEYGIEYRLCSEEFCLSLRCIKDDSLPLPEMPHKGTTSIPCSESEESIKSKIKELVMQVVKDPYYPYLAIINYIICKDSAVGDIIRPIWIPSEINSNIQVNIVVKRPYVECTYSKDGIVYSFISECNTRNIDDVVELSYEIFNRLGIVGYFLSNGLKAIEFINKHNILNDRKVDLPF
jgi:uncharacterized protein (TIGR02145 family)